MKKNTGDIEQYDRESRKLLRSSEGSRACVKLVGQHESLMGKITIKDGSIYVGNAVLPENKRINFMHF